MEDTEVETKLIHPSGNFKFRFIQNEVNHHEWDKEIGKIVVIIDLPKVICDMLVHREVLLKTPQSFQKLDSKEGLYDTLKIVEFWMKALHKTLQFAPDNDIKLTSSELIDALLFGRKHNLDYTIINEWFIKSYDEKLRKRDFRKEPKGGDLKEVYDAKWLFDILGLPNLSCSITIMDLPLPRVDLFWLKTLNKSWGPNRP